jgi:hypothetical protein
VNERVVFRNGETSLSLAPKIYVDGARIVGVGDRPQDGAAKEFDVLRDTWPGLSSERVLSKFLASGIRQLQNRTLMIRPNVVVSLETRACSPDEVRHALALAGIRHASFS